MGDRVNTTEGKEDIPTELREERKEKGLFSDFTFQNTK